MSILKHQQISCDTAEATTHLQYIITCRAVRRIEKRKSVKRLVKASIWDSKSRLGLYSWLKRLGVVPEFQISCQPSGNPCPACVTRSPTHWRASTSRRKPSTAPLRQSSLLGRATAPRPEMDNRRRPRARRPSKDLNPAPSPALPSTRVAAAITATHHPRPGARRPRRRKVLART